MAVTIESPCVNCFACMTVCPNGAISQSKPHFVVNPRKCTECVGDFETPQCAAICPVEEAILSADGSALNPLGTLTGIPADRTLQLRRRQGGEWGG